MCYTLRVYISIVSAFSRKFAIDSIYFDLPLRKFSCNKYTVIMMYTIVYEIRILIDNRLLALLAFQTFTVTFTVSIQRSAVYKNNVHL